MAELVNPDDIERIVGAQRLGSHHLGRMVTAENKIYILHSEHCLWLRDRRGGTLHDCGFTKALDEHDVDLSAWKGLEDQAVVLTVDGRGLVPRCAAGDL